MRFILSIALLVAGLKVHAQYEAANWFLHDYSSLDFKCTPPKRAEYPSKLSESCSISDNEGNVILYSDAQTVFNSQNIPVENGDIRINPGGDFGAHPVIIPWPGRDSLYILFKQVNTNIFHSIIDSRAKGTVVKRNEPLFNAPGPNHYVEGFAITGTPDKKLFWLVASVRSELNFFRIDATGISHVRTMVMGFHSAIPLFSPKGNKLALGCIQYESNFTKTRQFISIFDFDINSGNILNKIELPTGDSSPGTQLDVFQISANGKFLYTIAPGTLSTFIQYDISLQNEAEIIASAVEIYKDPTNRHHCYKPQLGIDGRIYFSCHDVTAANEPRVGLWNIPWPDKKGAACGGMEFFLQHNPLSQNPIFYYPWRMPEFPASFLFNDGVLPRNFNIGKKDSVSLDWVSIDSNEESSAQVRFRKDPGIHQAHLKQAFYGDTAWTNVIEIKDEMYSLEILNLRSDSTAYQFKLLGFDYCDVEKESTVLNTIHLTAGVDEGSRFITLTWNPYSVDENLIDHFEIWHQTATSSSYLFQSVPGDQKSFSDSSLYRKGAQQEFRIKGVLKEAAKVFWSNTVDVELKYSPVIANVITPNGDNKNDVLVVMDLDSFPHNELIIFNRWGKEIYRKKGYDNTWSGADYGLYYYSFVIVYRDGTQKTIKGWVQVIG